HSRALVLSSWKYVCKPRDKGGLGFLNLHLHLMARRTAFIMRITSSHKPLWTSIFWKFIENAEINFRGAWKLDEWNKFFSHAPWNGRQRYIGNSLASASPYWSFLTNPPIAFALGAEARYFNNKGIDSIAKCYNSKWEILPFSVVRRTYAVGTTYRSKWLQIISLLHKYQLPLSIDAIDPWRDWLFAKHTKWWTGKSNMYYRTLLAPDSIALQCNQRWKLKKPASWWHLRFASIRDSSFTYRMKIFMWKIFASHFTLGTFLSKHGCHGVRCPHCASYVENMRHAFWSCSQIQRWWNILFLFPIWDIKPTKFDCTFLLFDCANNVADWIKRRCIFLLLRSIWTLRNFKMFWE
ncbi:hypothetical protein KP509_31G003000, partial [Ceratopteris richardii]